MHVAVILQELLGNTTHKTRLKTLTVLIEGVINSKTLSLTSLGRHIKTSGKECSAINRVDRFLGNAFYQTRSIRIYEVLTRRAIGGMKTPFVIVDWSSIPGSHLTASGEHCVLRASLAAKGRSITLYEEVHPKSKEGRAAVHKAFLRRFKSLVPAACKPCILTDAGFKNPWFKAVLAMGWDYIGRLSGAVHYDDGTGFKALSGLFPQATSSPASLGNLKVAKTNPITTHVCLYKKTPQGRKHRGKSGKVLTNKLSRKNAKSQREPWILASSLTGKNIERLIVKTYSLRMTIEESFRDMKSQRYGLSLNDNVTLNVKRYIVWLLLAALASLIAWSVGYSAEKRSLHLDFQANTYKKRRVLSFFFLGCQVIKKRLNFPVVLDDIIRDNWGILLEEK
jgi:hypothetical protein